jgi:transcriptional regulator with XRE-family HTH domain
VSYVGLLWDIVQHHIDSAPYPPSIRQIARKIGVSPTTVSDWRRLRALPSKENLRALAELTGTPYEQILDAALRDTGYLQDAAPRPMTPEEKELWLAEQEVRDITDSIEAGQLIDSPGSRKLLNEKIVRLEELRERAGGDARSGSAS